MQSNPKVPKNSKGTGKKKNKKWKSKIFKILFKILEAAHFVARIIDVIMQFFK
jgi:hypothetical protein